MRVCYGPGVCQQSHFQRCKVGLLNENAGCITGKIMQEAVASLSNSNSLYFTKIFPNGTVLCYLVIQTAKGGRGRKTVHSTEVGPLEKYLGFINRSINNTFLFLLVLLLLICNIVLWA